jgi:hypothetical protein
MPEKVSPGPLRGNPAPQEAVCIHTRKVYDSCREKECLRDLRVYLTSTSQAILENSVNVKARDAELLHATIDVEPITYNRGFYTVDVRYFYRITLDASCGVGRPKTLYGLAVYDKRTVLFGSEGSARIFSSDCRWNAQDMQNPERTNLPVAVVEVVDPVVLGCKTLDSCCDSCCSAADVPADICGCFEEDLVVNSDGRQLFVTLGQFSIIKLERDIQLLMPAYDFCMPDKECAGNTTDPCALFQNFQFPVDEFFPPREGEFTQSQTGGNGNCGNHPQNQNGGCGCCGGNLSRRR